MTAGPADVAPQSEPDGLEREGAPEVDEALSSLADLDQAPLDEHPARLARAHELLHRRLHHDQAG